MILIFLTIWRTSKLKLFSIHALDIQMHLPDVFFHGVFLGLSPLPVTVANEGLYGSPTKNVIILVVTVTGRGDNPKYFYEVHGFLWNDFNNQLTSEVVNWCFGGVWGGGLDSLAFQITRGIVTQEHQPKEPNHQPKEPIDH